jgi:hypothetical protein
LYIMEFLTEVYATLVLQYYAVILRGMICLSCFIKKRFQSEGENVEEYS